MSTDRTRGLVTVLFVFLVIGLLSSPRAAWAGRRCNSECKIAEFPECISCDFTIFLDGRCRIVSCDMCESQACSASLPNAGDELAEEQSAGLKAQGVKVVNVEILSPRS